MCDFDWNELAFKSKKPVNVLKATFIMAPRELSPARLTQLVKQYLPLGNIVLGVAKEKYVAGCDAQPQFRMMPEKTAAPLHLKIKKARTRNRVYTLCYSQTDAEFLLAKLKFARVVVVNGSHRYAFHLTKPHDVLATKNTPYELVSPFADEAEAMAAADSLKKDIKAASKFRRLSPIKVYDDEEMMDLVAGAAGESFEYCFQVGAVLARPARTGYKFLAHAHNKVVPYETFAMHHGSLRERHLSPANDLNHYDAVHAETEIILKAAVQGFKLRGAALFVNLMPCPNCARLLADSPVAEIIYAIDHSEGYAVKLLEAAGKHIRRYAAAKL